MDFVNRLSKFKIVLLAVVVMTRFCDYSANAANAANAANEPYSAVKNQHIIKITPESDVKNNWFTKRDIVFCGVNDIIITTSCVERELNLPYCFNQNITFIEHDGDIISNVNYNYLFSDGNQQFIAQASCQSNGDQLYLMLLNTNFGNCKICEWIDVFASNGDYIGSTDGMYDEKNFMHKSIPLEFEKMISTLIYPIENNEIYVQIFRTR